MSKIVTVGDASRERYEAKARMDAKWDRINAKRNKAIRAAEDAWSLAKATDRRIGVVVRNSRPVFYAVVGTDPYASKVVESRMIEDIVAALAKEVQP